MKETKILWFTGLSGAGKTTISKILEKHFEKEGKTYKIFDGDYVRETLHKHLGFTKEDILENNRLILELCIKELGKVDYILVPVISPFNVSRKNARKVLGDKFIEIYLDCSYEECKKRDVKGHYKKAEAGELKNFIGLHVPYEKPDNPDIILDVVKKNEEECAKEIINYLNIS